MNTFVQNNAFSLHQVGDIYFLSTQSFETIDYANVISINETGAFLWKLLSKPQTQEELLPALVSEYDVKKEEAMADIHDFISMLLQVKALTVLSTPPMSKDDNPKSQQNN